MAGERIKVPYNHDLKQLEESLARVRRPGDFFVHGALVAPMPRVDVKGVGVLSFPVPSSQIQDLIRQAERAPYGRGGETIVDTSVRRTWQVAPANVRIGGRSWQQSFEQILSTVTAGLGCSDMAVSAELYKLLVYENGGFFLSHRDTEKAGGMFGTLTIVLPSAHRGGDLVIRHAGREVIVGLCSSEISELSFAAFYADCEHEVKPVTHGHRVCLIYNLIQRRTGKTRKPLTAPFYETEVSAAATMMEKAFQESGAPAKLVWLLEHQYTPAGLSFTGLKGEDAARANVLRRAAERSGCAVHLAVVHIEEYGAAEPHFDAYDGWGSRRRHYGGYDDYDEEVAEDLEDESHAAEFDVIDVLDGRRYVDQWVDANDRAVDFGQLPVEEGEVLPAGALDDENPDRQRLMEASGNEGASFERSYHRAALIVWPRRRFTDVLLQAGAGAALPYLKDLVQACSSRSASPAERDTAVSTARRIIEAWEGEPAGPVWPGPDKEPSRSEMIALLGKLADAMLLEEFVSGAVTRLYDGSENAALAANASLLGAEKACALFSRLARENMRAFPSGCANLLVRLIRRRGATPTAAWTAALRDIGAVIVDELSKLKEPVASSHAGPDRSHAEQAKPVDALMLADLLDSLAALDAPDLRRASCTAVAANSRVFDPAAVIVPALEMLHKRNRKTFSEDAECRRLWVHAADFLLTRSEHPPEPPKDWRQSASISCKCDDCGELKAFALDPLEHTHRFRVRKDRRQHLHRQIERHGLDMTHVTERRGSPQTLVCSKTRGAYRRQCAQHKADLASMSSLLRLMPDSRGEIRVRSVRMAAAKRFLAPD